MHLHVGDIERGLRFYRDLLGFEVMALSLSAAFVAAGGYHHHLGFNTWQGAGVAAGPRRTSSASTTGRSCCPERADVAALRARVEQAGVPVEERGDGAFLVRDPWSIPCSSRRAGSGVSPGPQGPMVPREPPAAHPIDPGVRVGHVHLRTADIDRVRAFYVDLLGFDVVAEARDVPGWGTTGDLLFVSAGGYHHHLGFNTWKSAGGAPQPDGVAGLHHVALNWPTRVLRGRRAPSRRRGRADPPGQ